MKGLYSIVGMQFAGTVDLMKSLPAGEPLVLEREPTNRFDSNAVKVFARGTHVGYLKAAHARDVAQIMDRACSGDQQPRLSAKLAITADRWPMAEVDL